MHISGSRRSKTPPKFNERTPKRGRKNIVAGEGKQKRNVGRSGGAGSGERTDPAEGVRERGGPGEHPNLGRTHENLEHTPHTTHLTRHTSHNPQHHNTTTTPTTTQHNTTQRNTTQHNTQQHTTTPQRANWPKSTIGPSRPKKIYGHTKLA